MTICNDSSLTAAIDVVLEAPIPYEVLRAMAFEYQNDWGGLEYTDQNAILNDCRRLAIVFLESMFVYTTRGEIVVHDKVTFSASDSDMIR